MPDIAKDGEGWALFKINIDKSHIKAKAIEVIRCEVSYKNNDGKTIYCDPVKLILEPLSPNAFEVIAENQKVASRIEEITVANIQLEAIHAARVHNWERVDFLINRAKNIAKDQFSKIHQSDSYKRASHAMSEMSAMSMRDVGKKLTTKTGIGIMAGTGGAAVGYSAAKNKNKKRG